MKKYNYDFIKQEFEKESYQLLSNKYNNCYSPLEFICPKGHRHKITWTKWI